MINVGIAGIGFMGLIHHLAYQRVRGARVTAYCSRNKKKLAGDWRGIKGNFGPPGTMTDLSRAATYRKLDDLLADDRVDLVDICLPPDKHAAATIAALKAGKHVFCEKPMAITVEGCDRMIDAWRKSGKHLMIGFNMRYMNIFRGAIPGKVF